MAEVYNAFYLSSSRGNDRRRCGCVDVDGANPDSGVNKEFVVSKSPTCLPPRMYQMQKHAHSMACSVRWMQFSTPKTYRQLCFDWGSAKSCLPKTKAAPMSVWSLAPHHVPESSTVTSTSTCPPGFLCLYCRRSMSNGCELPQLRPQVVSRHCGEGIIGRCMNYRH